MSNFLDKETAFFELPLTLKSRILILVATVALLPAFFPALEHELLLESVYGRVVHAHLFVSIGRRKDTQSR